MLETAWESRWPPSLKKKRTSLGCKAGSSLKTVYRERRMTTRSGQSDIQKEESQIQRTGTKSPGESGRDNAICLPEEPVVRATGGRQERLS